MINIETLELADAYIGSTPIEKAYLGSTLIWEKNTEPAYDAQVEWLATDGIAFIDTGFNPKSSTKIEIVMDVPTLDDHACWFFGSRNASAAQQLALFYNNQNTTQWSWRFGNKSATNSTAISSGIYTFDNKSLARRLYIKHNNATLTLTATNNSFTGTFPFYIFTLNVGGIPATGNIQSGLKCLTAKIWDNTTLVRDYIPVRKGNVGYLWDKIGEQLYGNADSSGAFTYGNDVT